MHFIRQILFIRRVFIVVDDAIHGFCVCLSLKFVLQFFFFVDWVNCNVCHIVYTWNTEKETFFTILGLQSLWITTVCSSQLQQYKQERGATNQPSIAYAQPIIIEKPPPTSVSSDKLLQTPTSSETGKEG